MPASADGPRPNVERLDVTQLGSLVRQHRGHLSLRQAAADIGISFSTLSRVEAGAQPDLASFTLLCAWLGLPASRFFTPITEREPGSLDSVIAHLNADPRLTAAAALTMGTMLQQMYANLAADLAPDRTLVACHLRAAAVMRPGVPQRLANLLTDMHTALEAQVADGTL